MKQTLSIRFIVLAILGYASAGPIQADDYDVLLRSPSLAAQRTALTAILRRPQDYIPRVQQSLRDYPKLLQADWTAANRAVHLAALLRDPSFPEILVRTLGDDAVLSECIYPCPAVFALTIHACFAGWTLPSTLDAKLDTVSDLQNAVRRVPRMKLEIRPLDTVTQGPGVERYRKEIEGKTEEQLIAIAGATRGSAPSPRLLAATALEISVVTSKNRIALYLLLMNDSKDDASKEFRSSIYEAIYRAETASARGR